MGLFDKKICDNCGAKIGLLGKRKLEDGIICKDCSSKLSPWFSERKQSTLSEIQEQLAYREKNKEILSTLNPTVKLGGLRSGDYAVYIDNAKNKFFVTAASNYRNANPDIIDMSQVISCRCDIADNLTEITYKGPDGEDHTRSGYEFVFWIEINVNNPYFNKMLFRLNSSTVYSQTPEFMSYQNTANQICAAFGGTVHMENIETFGGMNVNTMNMGMNTGGMTGTMNMGMPNNMNMGGMAAGMNIGMQNNTNMGSMMNQQGMNMSPVTGGTQFGMPGIKIKCSSCGWEPDDPSAAPKFCPNCGDKIDGSDVK